MSNLVLGRLTNAASLPVAFDHGYSGAAPDALGEKRMFRAVEFVKMALFLIESGWELGYLLAARNARDL